MEDDDDEGLEDIEESSIEEEVKKPIKKDEKK